MKNYGKIKPVKNKPKVVKKTSFHLCKRWYARLNSIQDTLIHTTWKKQIFFSLNLEWVLAKNFRNLSGDTLQFHNAQLTILFPWTAEKCRWTSKLCLCTMKKCAWKCLSNCPWTHPLPLSFLKTCPYPQKITITHAKNYVHGFFQYSWKKHRKKHW